MSLRIMITVYLNFTYKYQKNCMFLGVVFWKKSHHPQILKQTFCSARHPQWQLHDIFHLDYPQYYSMLFCPFHWFRLCKKQCRYTSVSVGTMQEAVVNLLGLSKAIPSLHDNLFSGFVFFFCLTVLQQRKIHNNSNFLKKSSAKGALKTTTTFVLHLKFSIFTCTMTSSIWPQFSLSCSFCTSLSYVLKYI